MGKSNSKLKPEVVEELTRKTYCKAMLRLLPSSPVSRRSTNSSSPLATPPSSPHLSSMFLMRTR
uniref:Uncharacterized protein n=1 Tax=Sinocyclocheilus grahami TaxID=75366 RepID=A0A672NN01_SINGR